ncbi:polyphosphate kinase 2 family protein [Spartinivicinus ruber]|uniref:polyphosphate kinase 2 family protein n=1 Tax=Spartinivicinus ruber TaxID=2683272 RepID=UPI0013D84FED|nr:polyphosphate kinase 2 family protein [Spartinivicinus ruber]
MVDLAYFLPPSQGELNLEAYNPSYTFNLDKTNAKKEAQTLGLSLHEWQTKLFAEQKQSVLIIFQAMDSIAKLSNLQQVFTSLSPHGISAHTFDPPGIDDQRHDFIRRFHHYAPSKGMIGIFSHSYYEWILRDIVSNNIDPKYLHSHATHINNFELLLRDSGTQVIKFYLHISRQEHRHRLLQRLANPEEFWKLTTTDLHIQKYWSQTIKSYEQIIQLTHSPLHPWYIIPSDYTWFRDLLIAKILNHTLTAMKPSYPVITPPFTVDDLPDEMVTSLSKQAKKTS